MVDPTRKLRRTKWLNYRVYRFQSQIIGNGSTRALAEACLRRCSFIQMVNAVHVVAIVRMPPRLFVHLAQ
jgi:hypothetical protein